MPSCNDSVQGVPAGIDGAENWPLNRLSLWPFLYTLMMRVSCESRLLTQLPLQSRCWEFPTVGSRTSSRFSTGSATIGNFWVGSGVLRNQLDGHGPVEFGSPVSPPSQPWAVMLTCAASLGVWVIATRGPPCLFPACPKLLSRYIVGLCSLSPFGEPVWSLGSSPFPFAKNTCTFS